MERLPNDSDTRYKLLLYLHAFEQFPQLFPIRGLTVRLIANQISVDSFQSEKCSLWRLGIRRGPRLFYLSELLPSSGADSAASMPWDPYLSLGLFKAMDSCRKSAVPDMPQSHWYMSTLIFNLLTILIINGTSFKDHHPLPYCIPAIWCLGRGLESQKAAL